MTEPDAPRMPRIRHDAVNILLRYLHAVDDHDLDEVVAALGDAEVDFGGPAQRGADALADLYRAAFSGGGRTRHLLHEASVEEAADGRRPILRAAYQRWSLESDPPRLTALGRYTAEFDVQGPTRLVRLSVHRDWQHRPKTSTTTPTEENR